MNGTAKGNTGDSRLEPTDASALDLHCEFEAAARFLKLLDESADRFTFQTFADRKSNSKRDHLARCRTGTLNDLWEWLVEQNQKGAGIFVTVNETDGLGRKLCNITRVRSVWQEDDGGGKQLPLEPHIVVASSPGRFHRYLLCEGLSIDEHRLVQRTLVTEYGSDANAADAARVLRMPGFFHLKGAEPYLVRIVNEDAGQPYPAAAILAAFATDVPMARPPLRGNTSATEYASPEQIGQLRSALNSLPSDERSVWIANGCRLRGLGEVGRELWITWSRKSPKWKPTDAQIWDTLPHDRTGYRAIFAAAQEHGWVNPMAGSTRGNAGNPASAPTIERRFGDAPAPALRVVPIGDLQELKPDAPRYAIAQLIPRRVVTLLAAHGGSGKTMLALTLAAHFAASRPWARFATDGGKALFISLEDPGTLVLHRLAQIVREYNLDAGTVAENLRIVDGTEGDGTLVREISERGVRRLAATLTMEELRALVNAAGFVIVDNASDAYDANENDRQMVRQFVRMLAQVARDNDAGLLLLAHVDKVAARYNSHNNSYSGSTAWHNSARSRLALVDEKGAIELRQEKLNLGKQAEPLALRFTDAGVLVPSNSAVSEDERAADALLESTDAMALLAALRAAMAADINIPTGRTGPSTAQKVLETVSEFPRSLSGPAGRMRFWRALERLQRDGTVSVEEYRSSARKVARRFVAVPAQI